MELGAVQQNSMFYTALPHGAAALAVGAVGVISAVAAGSTIGLIVGIALGILGAYGFIGVLTCAFTSKDANEFHQNVWKHMATAAGVGMADVLSFAIKIVIAEAISSFFNRKRA